MFSTIFDSNGGFNWKYLKQIIPLEIQVGVCAGLLTGGFVTCLRKFAEQESRPVFHYSDEKPSEENRDGHLKTDTVD